MKRLKTGSILLGLTAASAVLLLFAEQSAAGVRFGITVGSTTIGRGANRVNFSRGSRGSRNERFRTDQYQGRRRDLHRRQSSQNHRRTYLVSSGTPFHSPPKVILVMSLRSGGTLVITTQPYRPAKHRNRYVEYHGRRR